MALANYSDLLLAVADWTHRSDLTSRIPDWVTMLESNLNRKMRLRVMETDVALTTSVGSATAALPTTRYIAPIDVFMAWSGTGQRKLPKREYTELPFGVSNSPPSYWCIDGVNVRFDCPVDSTSAYSLTLRYWKALALATDTTNNLMTQHPDVYLYGVLVSAGRFLRYEPGLLTEWRGAFEQALSEVEASDNENNRATMTVDPGIQNQGITSNILEG